MGDAPERYTSYGRGGAGNLRKFLPLHIPTVDYLVTSATTV